MCKSVTQSIPLDCKFASVICSQRHGSPLMCRILRGPVGERIMDVVPRGTELELKLRRGVAIIPTSSVQEFIRHKQWNVDTNELYWVQFSGSWVPSITLTLMVQLHTKLLVTVRHTSAEGNWSTERLFLHSIPHIARAINTSRDHIQTKRSRRKLHSSHAWSPYWEMGVSTNSMRYRKARSLHDEISLWLAQSTYHNPPAEKKKSINYTATISIDYATNVLWLQLCLDGTP